MPSFLEIFSQLLKIVNLSIEYNANRLIFVEKRLLACLKINDREAAMSKPHCRLGFLEDKVPPFIRPSVVHCLKGSLYIRLVYLNRI
jgi:hypothetical protein